MKLLKFPEQTTVIAKDQPQYYPLPAHVDGEGKVTCCWKLTWSERLKILFTGRVWHQILTFGGALQPQLLLADKPQLSPFYCEACSQGLHALCGGSQCQCQCTDRSILPKFTEQDESERKEIVRQFYKEYGVL